MNGSAHRLLAVLARDGDLRADELARRANMPDDLVDSFARDYGRRGYVHIRGDALRVSTSALVLAGVGLDRHTIDVALTTLRGGLLAYHTRARDPGAGTAGEVEAIDELVARCLRQHGVDLGRLVGVGVGASTPADAAIAARLESRLGRRVFIDDRANLGALAEHWWGAGAGGEDVTYVDLGTRATAGHIVDGRLFRAAPHCLRVLGRIVCDTRGLPELEIGRLARRGDRDARACVAEAADHLAGHLTYLAHEIRPATIVVGGELTAAGDRLLVRSRRALRRSGVEVVTSALDEAAVPVGAATVVLEAALAHLGRTAPLRAVAEARTTRGW